MGSRPESVTELLQAWSQGDADAGERLIPLVYRDLRRRAARYLRPWLFRRIGRQGSRDAVTTMTPERWERVKSVFQSAIERTPGERQAFLSEACASDVLLHSEVESLVASHDQAGTFMAEPLIPPIPYLTPGDHLGPYEIVRLLGSGGMGDVYLARDARLEREVALKILSVDVAADPEHRQRLLHEARAVSALNHPNICTIYEIGSAEGRDYISFEHIQGQGLDALLDDGGLPLESLLELALPLAERAGLCARQGHPPPGPKAGQHHGVASRHS